MCSNLNHISLLVCFGARQVRRYCIYTNFLQYPKRCWRTFCYWRCCPVLWLVSVQAWADMKDRLKNRVIHAETLLKRGRWLWANDNQDNDGSKYFWVDELAERDTYYTDRSSISGRLNNGIVVVFHTLKRYKPLPTEWNLVNGWEWVEKKM